MKRVLYDLEEKKYTGRDAKKRKKVFTNLAILNMSRNGMGPAVAGSLSLSLGQPNCTLTHLDLCDNPLGLSSKNGGIARDAAADLRHGLGSTRSLTCLDLTRTAFLSTELVRDLPIFFLPLSIACINLLYVRTVRAVGSLVRWPGEEYGDNSAGAAGDAIR